MLVVRLCSLTTLLAQSETRLSASEAVPATSDARVLKSHHHRQSRLHNEWEEASSEAILLLQAAVINPFHDQSQSSYCVLGVFLLRVLIVFFQFIFGRVLLAWPIRKS